MAKDIVAVMDLQFGSTGKGQVAGTIGLKWKPDTVATAWGPNAGHTFRNGDFYGVSRMLATSATSPSIKAILIGPGSVIDAKILGEEIADRGFSHLRGKALVIHPQATVLQPSDSLTEASTLLRIGSTMKGTAEAAIRKIRRQEDATAASQWHELFETVGRACFEAGMSFVVSSFHYDRAIDESRRLLLEGAQGFSLGLHTDFYPYCTGRDVSTAQLFADCRVPWPRIGTLPRVHVVGVCRTYPIRVANRKVQAEDGSSFTHSSGSFYPDQEEISWNSLGKNAELTTVTKLPRRIFTFSDQQIREAVRVCGPGSLALTFMDYVPEAEQEAFIDRVEKAAGVAVKLVSYGPDISNMCERDLIANVSNPLGDLDYLPGGAHDYVD